MMPKSIQNGGSGYHFGRSDASFWNNFEGLGGLGTKNIDLQWSGDGDRQSYFEWSGV